MLSTVPSSAQSRFRANLQFEKKNRPDTVQQPYSLVQNSFLSSLMANGTMFYQGNQLTLTQFSLEAYLLQPTAEWLKLLESLNFSS
jgi:hypothetical protein